MTVVQHQGSRLALEQTCIQWGIWATTGEQNHNNFVSQKIGSGGATRRVEPAMRLWSIMMERGHDCIRDSPNVSTSVELPPLSFFFCLWFKNKHDLGVRCSWADTGLFLFCFASGSVKETDKTESVKENRYCQTDTLAERAGILLKKHVKTFFLNAVFVCGVLQWMSFKLPPLRRLCSASLWTAGCQER